MYDFVAYYSDEVWIQAASSIVLQELWNLTSVQENGWYITIKMYYEN